MKASTLLKTAVFVVILAALGVAGSLYLRTAPDAAKAPVATAAPPPVAVSVAAAREMPVTIWDEFSGRVMAIDHVEVRPRVSGMIEAIHFQDGQLVKQGDPLFTIDPRPFQADLDHAVATQTAAQARLAWAQTAVDRSHKLILLHAVAQSDLDEQNDTLLEAQANLQAAAAAVVSARLNLEYSAITAPVTGRVSRAEITVGNLVGAGVTAPVLTTVVSVSPVYVDFEIDEQTYIRYAAQGAAGNDGINRIPVEMGLASEEGYPHQGRLASIDNQLDTTSGTIRVRAVFDNTSGELTPGLYARVRTGEPGTESAILVDDRAVGTDQDKRYVMVVDADNKASYRTVTLGPIANGMRVIRSGLQKDERIVVDGLQRVHPNDIVAPVTVSMSGDHVASSSP
jgi:multidrug efflux system membrane fusion protein